MLMQANELQLRENPASFKGDSWLWSGKRKLIVLMFFYNEYFAPPSVIGSITKKYSLYKTTGGNIT
jgi:hypothetical protein